MNFFSEILFWYKRKIEPGFKIDKNSLVVDIGSGEKPFWRADVYVDKLTLGNVQRATNKNTISDFGLFVNSDVEEMPFKDKAFDFSFSSHLLEHVENPDKVIREITRVSKRGYIEVPNGILETIKPFGSHLWFVYKKKNSIVFVRKSKYMHKLLSENGLDFDKLIGKVDEPFIRFYWSKKINYEIYDNNEKKDKFLTENNKEDYNDYNSQNPYGLINRLLRILFYREKNKNVIDGLIK